MRAETTWAAFPALWPQLLDEVWAFLRAGGAAKAGHNVMLYKDDVPNVEVGVQVATAFNPAGNVVPSTLPGGRVAKTVHRGSPHTIKTAHDAVVEWCATNGYRTAGPRWEIYGDPQPDDADFETEVYWLLV